MNSPKGFLVVVALLAVALCNDKQGSRAADTNDGLLVETKTYAFPTYEQAVETTDVEKYSSKQVYEKAVGDQNYEFQKLKYMSDGLKVVAYLSFRSDAVRAPQLKAISVSCRK